MTSALVEGRARMYGGASPATGEDARFALEGETLLVTVGAASYTVPLAAIRIREVGTGAMGLEFAWDAEGVAHALICG